MLQQSMEQVCSDLMDYFQKTQFKGYDPFDGLNSKLFQVIPFIKHQRICKLAWLQLHKRLPINFRKLVGVVKSVNPKAIALIIMGLVYAYRRQRNPADLKLAKDLALEFLLPTTANQSQQNGGWGYPFPWQARAFFVEQNEPNVIVTSYVVNALALLAEETSDSIYFDAIIKAGHFVLTQLYNQQEKYFFYVSAEPVLVHNANLWGAVTVARAGLLSNNDQWVAIAKEACQLTVDAQSDDGSWVYGSLPHHQFIDGFHTGYNLEALAIYQDLTGDKNFHHAITQGLNFYRQHFFDDLGRVKYYHQADYPLDVHSVSQAILTLSKLGNTEDSMMLNQVIQYALNHLFSKKTRLFYYQKNRWLTNKIVYLRWTQAWMYYSFNYLLYKQSVTRGKDEQTVAGCTFS